MKKTLLAVMIAAALSGGAARAELCAIDAVPAATLLLPYFEVDMGFFPKLKKTEQTIIQLQNADDEPIIARVTLWTDLSVTTTAFDVFLKGFAIEKINLAELFYTGEIDGLPIDAAGTRGLVLGETPTPGVQNRFDLIRAHRGESVFGSCYGVFTGDNKARGYVTIDQVNSPSQAFPDEPMYFQSGGDGVAGNRNVLLGSVRVVSKKAIQSNELVHIEAADGFSSGDYTFYGRYVGFDASDGREPLGSSWSAQFSSGKEPTELIVWRDSAAIQGPFGCNGLGSSGWYPLATEEVEITDGDGDLVSSGPDPDDQPFFPAETQKVRLRGPLTDSAGSGWILATLGEDDTQPLQSVVWVVQRSKKNASVYSATSVLHACGGSVTPSTAAPIP